MPYIHKKNACCFIFLLDILKSKTLNYDTYVSFVVAAVVLLHPQKSNDTHSYTNIWWIIFFLLLLLLFWYFLFLRKKMTKNPLIDKIHTHTHTHTIYSKINWIIISCAYPIYTHWIWNTQTIYEICIPINHRAVILMYRRWHGEQLYEIQQRFTPFSKNDEVIGKTTPCTKQTVHSANVLEY